MFTYIKVTGVSFLFTAFLLSYWISATSRGIEWMLNHVLISDSSCEISIKQVHGSLLGVVYIGKLSVHSDLLQSVAKDVLLKVDLASLLDQRLLINNIDVSELSIEATGNPDRATRIAKLISPAYVIEIERGQIRRLKYNDQSGTPPPVIELTNVDLRNISVKERIYLDSLTLTTKNANIRYSGYVGLEDHYLVSLTMHGQYYFPWLNKHIAAEGTAVGTLNQLRFYQKFSAPYNFTVTGVASNPLADLSWNMSVALQNVRSTDLLSDLPNYLLQGTVNLQGDFNHSKAEGKITVDHSGLSKWNVSLQADYFDEQLGFSLSLAESNKQKNKIQINTKGRLFISNPVQDYALPQLELTATAKNLRWPIEGASVFQMPQSQLAIENLSQTVSFFAPSAKLSNLGIELREIKLHGGKTDHTISLQAQAASGKGDLQLISSLALENSELKLKSLNINGKYFSFVRTPASHIIASPSLQVTPDKNNELIMSGTLDIPKANVLLDSGAFVTYLEGGLNNAKPLNKLKIINTELTFGENVWLHGFGLNSRISGMLSLTKNQNQQLIGNGTLRLRSGRYQLSNESLQIKKGWLKYVNNPLANPNIQIVANDANAVNQSHVISGRLQSPLNSGEL